MSTLIVEATMIPDRTTKRTVRYREIDEDGIVLELSEAKVGQVYLKKADLGDHPPASIYVRVEVNSTPGGAS